MTSLHPSVPFAFAPAVAFVEFAYVLSPDGVSLLQTHRMSR